MKNKFTALLAVALLLAAFQSALAQTNPVSIDNCAGYNDVVVTDPYCHAIQYVTDQSIFSGSDTTMVSGEKYFHPNDNINRAEVLKVILRAGGDATAYDEIATMGSEVGFNDIAPDTSDWWLGFLKQAKAKGIIKGYGDGSFRAVNPVSRAEYLKMLLEASPSQDAVHNWTITPSIELWADTPANAWYAQYIAFANHYGLFADFTECSYGNICPERAVLRKEAAQMIYNYQKYLETDLGIGQDIACIGEGGTFNATTNPATHCCKGLISYFPMYSRNQAVSGAGGVCLAYDADLAVSLSRYNTENSCTTNPDLGQSTTQLPFNNQNFYGYSFPMQSFKEGCAARCDVNLEDNTETIGWMCTGLITN